jgi:hypothetical protein
LSKRIGALRTLLALGFSLYIIFFPLPFVKCMTSGGSVSYLVSSREKGYLLRKEKDKQRERRHPETFA